MSSKPKHLTTSFSEPSWHTLPSPYYKQSHHTFRNKIHSFVSKHILPFVNKWDEDGSYPSELRTKAYEAGIYGALWPQELGGTRPPNFDHFHSFIWHDELARCGCGGLMASCFLPPGWGLKPIVKHGIQDKQKQLQVCKDVITGKSTIALAVTEPNAGSDVGNIQTTAVIEDDYYIINGEKYFISGGLNADYLTVAVRTTSKSQSKNKFTSLSFVLVDVNYIEQQPDHKHGRIFRTKMKTQGWWLGNTTYIVFKNVRVPISYTIGERDKGFIPILENFNHGRFAMASTAIRYSRCCLEDAIRFAQKRVTFGKRLIDHQVIAHKIVNMSLQIEQCQAEMEKICYCLDCGIGSRQLASLMSRIKINASKCMQFCARESSQIFGGRSYLRTGSAARVERISREVTVMGIAEGATEVLTDLIIKQAKL